MCLCCEGNIIPKIKQAVIADIHSLIYHHMIMFVVITNAIGLDQIKSYINTHLPGSTEISSLFY